MALLIWYIASMRQSILSAIFLLAIIAILFEIFGDRHANSPETAQEYAEPVITLEYLQAQPEWNPTLSAPGIERIDASEVSLPISELVGYDINVEGFAIYKNYVRLGLEHCTFPDPHPLTRCSEFGPEAYTEIFLASEQTNEIIHAYRLVDNYSFLTNINPGPHDEPLTGAGGPCDINGMKITAVPWRSFQGASYYDRTEDIVDYCLDVHSGELTKR